MRAYVLIALLLAVAAPALGQPAAEAAGGARPDRVTVPEPDARTLQYHRSGNVLWAVGAAWGLLVPAILLFTGFSARLRDLARALGRRWYIVVALYCTGYLLIVFLADLPLSYYAGFVRQHAYGLSNQTFGAWLGDQVKGLMVVAIAGVLFLWIPYRLIAASPRRWWLYTGLLAVPFSLFVLLVAPIWIDPLFDDFGPMRDQALESRILELAERAGIGDARVLEVDKSADTERVNAYVTGVLGTHRIVLWDTAIAKLDDDELLFVVGHEMGHYVLHHTLIGVLLASGGTLGLLLLVHLTANRLIRRYKDRFGFDRLADIASLPLLAVLLGACSLVFAPVSNAVSRAVEHQADVFGLELTRDPAAAGRSFVKLQVENLAHPRPGWFDKLWRASHPTLGERIDFCNGWASSRTRDAPPPSG